VIFVVVSRPGSRPWPINLGATLAVVAVVLTTALGVFLGFTQQEIAFAQQTAKQAIADSQLYVDSNEMDTDLTQIMLSDGAPALASERLNGLTGYQTDSDAVDTDLLQAQAFTLTSGDRRSIENTEQDLTAYRVQADAAKAATTQAAGIGPYNSATALAHDKLLPAALSVADGPAGRMNASLRHAHALSIAGVIAAALLGVVLLGLLSIAVLVSRRIWRRRFSVPWIGAMLVLMVVVTTASIAILHVGDTRLKAGQNDLAGFLAGQQAGGAAYDVAADPARYLISGKNHEWPADATTAGRQVRESVSGEARISWDVFDNAVGGLFTGIDTGRVAPADVSLYNTGGGVHQGLVGFRGFLSASEERLVSAGADRLPAAHSVFIVWFLIPIGAMLITMFLAAQIVQPGRRRTGESQP
jgi:hypothetical protein